MPNTIKQIEFTSDELYLMHRKFMTYKAELKADVDMCDKGLDAGIYLKDRYLHNLKTVESVLQKLETALS